MLEPPSPPDRTWSRAVPWWERFEQAWLAWQPGTEPPAWDRFLPAANEPCAPEDAFFLVQTDVEFRVKAGLPALLAERYFDHSRLSGPEGPFDHAGKGELIRWEYQQRWKNGQPVARADYLAAFPECAAELSEMTPRWDCPACRQQGIVLDDEDAQTLACPNCVGKFSRAEVFQPRGHPSDATPATRVQSDTEGPGGQFLGEPPSRVGRYLLEGELGRGGMGVVLLARDTAFDRRLAIKVLRETNAGWAEAERRFLDEARLTAQLQHPGIPPVHDVGRLEDGRPFFAMKLIRGRTLEQLLRERKPAEDLPRFLDVFEQVCQTLAYAHSRGVIHRDLKPHNVMVGAFGEVQVMDWGLAKVLTDSRASTEAGKEDVISATETLTQTGSVVGTPPFMAPEQARGEIDRLDERCDVFGLGAILCTILTGQPPFTDKLFRSVLQQSGEGDLSEAHQRLDRCGADADLVGLAKKCLAADKGDRYANAGEVAAEVGRYRRGVQERLRQAELERERSQVQAREERRRRRVTLALAAALLVLLLGAGGVTLWFQQQRSEQQSRGRRLNAGVAQALDAAESDRRRLHDRLADPNEVAVLLSDLRPWTESLGRAWSSWRQARKLADGEPDLLDPESRERLQSLEAKLKADDANHETARAFDALRLEIFEDPRWEAGSATATRKYLQFFEEKGWRPGADALPQTAERLRRSPLRYVATAALDLAAWAAFTKQPADRKQAEEFMALARRIDPHPWRDRFRQVPVWDDPARVCEVATALNVRQQPPQVVMVAADLLNRHKADAAGLLREAILRRAGDFWLNYTLGLLSPDPHEQVSSYRAALAIRPSSGAVYSNLGVALGARGILDAAIAHFNRALELDPKNIRVRCNLGAALEKKGDLDAAAVHFARALELDPQDGTARHNLAVTSHKQGLRYWSLYRDGLGQKQTAKARQQLEKAIAAFEKAGSLEPKVGDHRAPLAQGYACQAEMAKEAGRLEEAAAEYRKGRRLYERLRREDAANPSHRRMLTIIDMNLAEIQLETGHPEEALRTVLQVLRERKELAARYPQVRVYRDELMRTRNNAAALARRYVDSIVGAKELAPSARKAAALKARQLLEGAAREHGDVPAFKQELSRLARVLNATREN